MTTAGIPFSFVANTFGIPTSWWGSKAGMVAAAMMAGMLVQLFFLALNLKLRKKTTQIGDLPDFILVEILARLPCKRTLFRAKCVSKRWLCLLSDPYFVRSFLSLQGVDGGNAFIGAGILYVLKNKNLKPKLKVLAHPVVKIKESYLSLDFLPCIEEENELEVQLEVADTYNDLVLCCKSYRIYEGDYEYPIFYIDSKRFYCIHNPFYICNPYTKQWVALPSNNLRVPYDYRTHVRFVCEPYFKYSEETSMITFDAEYKWSVVQMLIPSEPSMTEMHIEIFSSETRQWKSLVVQSPPSIIHLCGGTEVAAYNGKLYRLLGYQDYIVEFDPTFSGDDIDQCRFRISANGRFMFLGVCGGRLRMCKRHITKNNLNYVDDGHLSVWEWKEGVDGIHNWCLIVDHLSMTDLVLKHPLVSENKLRCHRQFTVLSFHPYNEDVVFLWTNHPDCIAVCNMRERTLEIFGPDEINMGDLNGPSYLGRTYVCPFVIPWLPTPVPVL